MESDHTAHCINCLATDSLEMRHNRRDNKVIGFVFLCPQCIARLVVAEEVLDVISVPATEEVTDGVRP